LIHHVFDVGDDDGMFVRVIDQLPRMTPIVFQEPTTMSLFVVLVSNGLLKQFVTSIGNLHSHSTRNDLGVTAVAATAATVTIVAIVIPAPTARPLLRPGIRLVQNPDQHRGGGALQSVLDGIVRFVQDVLGGDSAIGGDSVLDSNGEDGSSSSSGG